MGFLQKKDQITEQDISTPNFYNSGTGTTEKSDFSSAGNELCTSSANHLNPNSFDPQHFVQHLAHHSTCNWGNSFWSRRKKTIYAVSEKGLGYKYRKDQNSFGSAYNTLISVLVNDWIL